MSKSRVCAERTINLAKQTCTRKTNLLVYEREKGEGCKPQPKTFIPPITSPQVKRIKVCTGAELKKMCPPPPCPCPPALPRTSFFKKLLKILGFGAKSLIALGVIFVTYDMGIWGDSETTAQLYKSLCNFFLPFLVEPAKEKTLTGSCKAEMELFSMSERDPYCCDKFPIDHESGMYELQQKWNKIVSKSFSKVAELPNDVKNASQKLLCKVVDSESCKKKAEEEAGDCCPCQ